MAYTILWMDGFDEMGNVSDKYVLNTEYRDSYIESTIKAFGYGRSMKLTVGTTAYFSKILPSSPHTVLFTHFHMYVGMPASGEKTFITFRDEQNDLAQFEIRLIYDGVSGTYLLRMYRGSTLVATSSAGIPLNVWTSLSIKYVCDSTTGECSVNLNGINVASFTGNTQNGASAQVHRVKIANTLNALGTDVYLDNIVIAGGLGSDPALPECRIYGAVVPTSNFSTSFTPSAGTNWSNVTDIPPNDDTSYNYSNTVGAKDVFVCSAPTVSGAVLAVRANYRARKDDAGIRYTKAVLRPGSTDYDGSQQVQPYTTYWTFGETWQNNPDTGLAWTPGDLANLKFGYKIES